ncbi:MAG: DUF1624 domain-containing protein [Oscillospiraceae bacterium]|nr:DUF1624 domain-containing protein [Oscillospiraceae bacterium]
MAKEKTYWTRLANANTPEEVDGIIAEGNGGMGGAKRLEMLDEFRGLAVIFMLVFHSVYLLNSFFGLGAGGAYAAMLKIQPAFAGLFILIAGMAARYSRDPVKRAGFILALALGLSLVTIVVLPGMGFTGMNIAFGILHLLSVSMLIFALGQRFFDKIPSLLGAPLMLFLFCFTAMTAQGKFGLFGLWPVNLPAALYETNALFFLGFHKPDFLSWDYFPLLPWFFLYMFGVYLGALTLDKDSKEGKLPDFVYRRRFIVISWIGRHALAVYLLHLPALYALFYLVFDLGGRMFGE